MGTNDRQERGQYPLTHPPENTLLEPITHCANESSATFKLDRDEGLRPLQHLERLPPGLGDFTIEQERGAGLTEKHEGTDENRREKRRARGQIVQHADQRTGREVEADLLPGLPPGGIDKSGIARAPSSSWKGQVTRPLVSLAIGPAYQQDAVGIWSDDDRDRSLRTVGVVDARGRSGGESRRKLVKPAQCW